MLHASALGRSPGPCLVVEDDARPVGPEGNPCESFADVRAALAGVRSTVSQLGARQLMLLSQPGNEGALADVGPVVASCCAYAVGSGTDLAQEFFPLYGDVPLQIMALRYAQTSVHPRVFVDMSKHSWDSCVSTNNTWSFHPKHGELGDLVRKGDLKGALACIDDTWSFTDAAMYHHMRAVATWNLDRETAAAAFREALLRYQASGVALDGSRSAFLNEYMNFSMQTE